PPHNLHYFPTRRSSDLNNGILLFCCRMRNMRPQGAYYNSIPKNIWHLFDACGEEREVGKNDLSNTPKPSGEQTELERAPKETVQDRKSTRLNSSHVSIS